MIEPLTSLRALFAIFVFLSHLSFLNNSSYEKLFNYVFHDGFLGVSFFFILSGFILAYNYQDKFLKKNISIRSFYISRLARIYPMHIATLLFALILSFFSSNDGYRFLFQHIFLIQNFFSNKDIYFSLNAPSWSISNEMFFYLLFPFLIFFNNKIKLILFVLGVVLILLLNRYLDEGAKHYWLYIFPGIRLFDFLLGIIVFNTYLIFKSIYSRYSYFKNVLELFSLLIFILFFVFHVWVEISYRYSIYYWIPMVLVILTFSLSSLCCEKGYLSQFFSNKYLVWGGEVSFCFYLIHVFVIQIGYFIYKKIGIDFNLLFLALIMFFVTLFFSSLAYTYIEKPLNKKIKEKFL